MNKDNNQSNQHFDNSLLAITSDGSGVKLSQKQGKDKKKGKRRKEYSSIMILTDEMFEAERIQREQQRSQHKHKHHSHSRHSSRGMVLDFGSEEQQKFNATASIKKSEEDGINKRLEMLGNNAGSDTTKENFVVPTTIKKVDEDGILKKLEYLSSHTKYDDSVKEEFVAAKSIKKSSDDSFYEKLNSLGSIDDNSPEVQFKAAKSIKKSDSNDFISESNTVHIKKSENNADFTKVDESLSKSLVFANGKKIVELVDADADGDDDISWLTKAFYKTYYKLKGKTEKLKRSQKHIATESFIIRTIEIWSLLILANVVVFFIKPITNGLINQTFSSLVPDIALLTMRYIPIWIIIPLFCVKTAYKLGYQDIRGKIKISRKRQMGIFACAYFMFVAVAVFFMDFLNPLPLLGALSVNGAYFAALVTGARNLKEIVSMEFRVINTFSISLTLLMCIIPVYISFKKGSYEKMHVKTKGVSSKHKKSEVFILETEDATINKAGILKKNSETKHE